MNVYKKLERLERQNEELRKENEKLRWGIKDTEAMKEKAEAMMNAANQKEQEFNKLIMDLEKAKKEYKEMINAMRFKIVGAEKKYKEAYKKAKKDTKNI